jgi:hypothetical protein
VVGAQGRVDDVEGPVTALEPVLDEREHHLVLLVRIAEERADVAVAGE